MTAKRAVVMGLGRFGGGLAATRHLVGQGYAVTVTDSATAESLAESLRELEGLDVRCVLGGHDDDDFARADLVVANPAVPPGHPLLERARAQGARVTSELELFLETVPASVVLVTGTQGKSSTAALLAGFLEAAGRRVRLGGNIGRSLLPDAHRMDPDEICVVEVSSYQLEAFTDESATRVAATGRVRAAAITNVLLDHLERHGDAASYAEAKLRVVDLVAPGGTVLLPAADARLWQQGRVDLQRVAHGTDSCSAAGSAAARVFVEGGRFRWREQDRAIDLGNPQDLPLPAFQRANAWVALGLAHACGAPAAELQAALPNARGLEHRLEDLGTVGGHRVWDNAVSTTPDSTLSALQALSAPLTWLCGGAAKELDYGDLQRAARERCARVIVFGRDAQQLAQPLEALGVTTDCVVDVQGAVALAFERMQPGEELLFSPACASFDAYSNFRERALAFRAALREVPVAP